MIITTIPYGGGPMTPSPYDVDWARGVAQHLGLPYAEVDASALFTGDGVHLSASSANLFSERLATALISLPVDIAHKVLALSQSTE